MRMISPFQGAAVLVVLGLVVGTLADRTPRRAPLRAGGYEVLSGDFHVHSFPGDGVLAPWMLRDEAARAGLDVIAVTNHNQVFTGRLAGWISNRSGGPLMIAGQEITNPAYHLIAVGLERAVNADQPAASAAADVHAQGGVAIAAHPSARFAGYDPDDAVRLLDGTEVAHPAVHQDDEFRAALSGFYQRARRAKPEIAAIGSSDFHGIPPPLGQCRTYVFVRERSETGVIDAIRSGRTLAVDGDGNLHGDPALIDLVPEDRPAGRSDVHRPARRLSLVLAWIGVLGMVLFRLPGAVPPTNGAASLRNVQ
jgi:hypothetical protein